ncbi:MAG TPA: TOMM precursor leader peptide-binding protein [Archangium sp.]|nr:TOMM precursor leader peptide-binding protein [Archangium sp.]
MQARGLQVIRLNPERCVLKRGIHELVVSGTAVNTVVEPLLTLLDGTRDTRQLLDSFSADLRPDVQQLLEVLQRRGLVSAEPAGEAEAPAEGVLERAFFDNFGPMGKTAPELLRQSTVLVVGVNLISRSLVRGLLECGVGRVLLAGHPILDNHVAPSRWVQGLGALGNVELLDAIPDEEAALRGVSLLCATCDFGEAEALLEMNRLALRHGKPFLPVWLSEMQGAIGPLNYPRETACLRCYRLRSDSNHPKYELARAIRARMTSEPEARQSVGLLSPMPGVLGEIATVEISKALGQYLPADSIGRVIDINLVSFSSMVRRVLKIPRCPDCSEQTRCAPMALMRGPQITQKG